MTNYPDPPEPLVLTLRTPPGDDRPVYVAGNFNNWTARDAAYRLQKTGDGEFQFRFSPDALPQPPLEYKYLRGDWSGAEIDRFGNEVPNRIVRENRGTHRDYVPRWRHEGQNYRSEFLPQVRVISDHFDPPAGVRTRRVAALLPHDYEQSRRRYPVLYLQDGQNLFDDHAPFGSWNLLRQLAGLQDIGRGNFIVIAIDHAEAERVEEYTPSFRTKLGVGQGKEYVRYLRNVVKPFVDDHFRTLPGREHTGIGGSSMGGLISIYAGLMFPDCYSKLMIFSPSLWVAPNIYKYKSNTFGTQPTRVYLYGGGQESRGLLPQMKRFQRSIERADRGQGQLQLQVQINPEGGHNEAEWGREFPRAAEWLFYG